MSVYSAGQQFSAISCSSTGSNTIVSAVSGKSIKVVSYVIVCSSAEVVQWKSSTTTNLSGAMSFATNSGVSAQYCPLGLFKTAAGQALTMNLTTGVQISGHLVYVLE